MSLKFAWAGALILPFALIGCKGDGPEPVPQEARAVSGDFNKIRNEGTAGIYIRVGTPTSVRVLADSDAMSHVTTRVENSTLVVKTEENYKPKTKIRVAVVMPHLVDIDVEGSGNVNFQNMLTDPLNIDLNGSGNVEGDGTAKSVTADLAGSGNIDFLGLNVPSVKIKINGSGNVGVWPANSLDVVINGSGNVTYKGSPEVHKIINGSGNVIPHRLG